VVWLTADVHYCAAHYYDPQQAQFRDFDPFWEFVAGPLNAGTFGPNQLDNTFGPQVVFQKTPEGGANFSPYAGLQFFGQVDIYPHTATMLVNLKDIAGNTVFRRELEPGCSPGSTLKKKKGQTSDQCGSHHHTMGGLAYAKTQGLGPTVPQPGLFPLSADAPGQR
jgi:hypothetical protein